VTDGPRARMQADLRAAMQARAEEDVSVLRSCIAALGNAEAVRTEDVRAQCVVGVEVDRRELTTADEQRILAGVHDELLEGADELQRLGHDERAAVLRRQAVVVARYLD
jgi:uncharacterized protein